MWASGAVGSAREWHSRGHRFDPGLVHQPSLTRASPKRELRLGERARRLSRRSPEGAKADSHAETQLSVTLDTKAKSSACIRGDIPETATSPNAHRLFHVISGFTLGHFDCPLVPDAGQAIRLRSQECRSEAPWNRSRTSYPWPRQYSSQARSCVGRLRFMRRCSSHISTTMPAILCVSADVLDVLIGHQFRVLA